MDRDEFSFRLITALSDILRECHGEISRIQRELRLDESYLRSMRRRAYAGSPQLRRLGAFLELGGIPPEVLCSRAFPESADPLSRFASEARILERRKELPKVLAVLRARHAAGDLRNAPHDARASDIDQLWRERLTNPSRAGRRAATMARYASERPFVARALGVWGSVLRMRNDLTRATIVLGVAIELAEDYPTIRAELAQRAAYVLSQRARHQDASHLAEMALVLFVRCADKPGVGRALVDSGKFLDRCGEPDQAIAAYTAALGFLPPSEDHNRCTAHQGLALVFVSQNRLREADFQLQRALRIPALLPEIETARFLWLRARIARARGEATQALLFFEKTLSLLETSPVDYALAAAELVLLRLESGHVAEAVAQAKALTSIALQLDNELIEGAVANLILAARKGELTIAATETLVTRMHRAGAGTSLPRPRARKRV